MARGRKPPLYGPRHCTTCANKLVHVSGAEYFCRHCNRKVLLPAAERSDRAHGVGKSSS